MTWQTEQLLAVGHLAICLAIAWVCICRLNAAVCKRLLLPRVRYTLLLTGALASGGQPALWGEWPGVGSVLFGLAVLAGLLLNIGQLPPKGAPRRRSTDV